MGRFQEYNTPIQRVLATGGIAAKSPYVIQVLADVLNTPIDVVDNDQTCALGAVIFAVIAAGSIRTFLRRNSNLQRMLPTPMYPWRSVCGYMKKDIKNINT